MKYPKYTFLTYGSYELQWWTKVDGNLSPCSHKDVADVLQFSLAVLHFPVLPQDNHLSFHATWTLAYALHNAIKEFPDVDSSVVDASGLDCVQWNDYKSRGFAPMLLTKYLLATNLTGMSVSIFVEVYKGLINLLMMI